jgi:hypothetical protein
LPTSSHLSSLIYITKIKNILILPKNKILQGWNLGDIIDAKPKHEVGVSGPCSDRKLCESMRQTKTFSGRDGTQFQVRGNFNCESVDMVYAMHCDKYSHVVYVGKSKNSLREQCYAHRRDFNIRDRGKPVAHFLEDGHELRHMKVVGVEQVRERDDILRVVRERFWIQKLETLQEENQRW